MVSHYRKHMTQDKLKRKKDKNSWSGLNSTKAPLSFKTRIYPVALRWHRVHMADWGPLLKCDLDAICKDWSSAYSYWAQSVSQMHTASKLESACVTLALDLLSCDRLVWQQSSLYIASRPRREPNGDERGQWGGESRRKSKVRKKNAAWREEGSDWVLWINRKQRHQRSIVSIIIYGTWCTQSNPCTIKFATLCWNRRRYLIFSLSFCNNSPKTADTWCKTETKDTTGLLEDSSRAKSEPKE